MLSFMVTISHQGKLCSRDAISIKGGWVSSREICKAQLQNWGGQGTAKVLLGCAVFAEILKPVGILSKVLQNEEICLYESIESVMKTKKSLEKLKATPFRQLPIVKKVINRIKEEFYMPFIPRL